MCRPSTVPWHWLNINSDRQCFRLFCKVVKVAPVHSWQSRWDMMGWYGLCGSVIKHIKLRLPGLGTRILCDQGRTLQGALLLMAAALFRFASDKHPHTFFFHLVSLPVQTILTYTILYLYTYIVLIRSSGNFRTGLFDIFLKLSSSGRPVQNFSFFWASGPCEARPDLVNTGRTLFGKLPTRHQQGGLHGKPSCAIYPSGPCWVWQRIC